MTGRSPNGSPWLAFAIVMLGVAAAPLDFALSVAFPAITQAFALQTADVRWVAISYVLTYGSLMLAFGALGDRVGHLRVFRAGLVLSVLGLLACALAPSFGTLLTARVAQGLGAALTLSCAPALSLALYDESRRTSVLSAYGGLFALISLAAPLIGGAMIAAMGWTGVFWFRVPLSLAALLALPRLARGVRRTPAALTEPVASAEPAPTAPPGGWLARLAFWRLEAWRQPAFRANNGASVLLQYGSFTVPLVLPYYLAQQGQWHPTAMGAMLGCWALGTVLGSSAAARLTRAWGEPQAARRGALLATLTLAVGALWPAEPSVTAMVPGLFLQGLGLGVFQVAYADHVVGALPASQRGVAGSLTMVTRTLGTLLGAMTWLSLLQWTGGADAMVGYRAVYAMGAAVAAAGAVWLWLARRSS